jgi:hypothetical protein
MHGTRSRIGKLALRTATSPIHLVLVFLPLGGRAAVDVAPSVQYLVLPDGAFLCARRCVRMDRVEAINAQVERIQGSDRGSGELCYWIAKIMLEAEANSRHPMMRTDLGYDEERNVQERSAAERDVGRFPSGLLPLLKHTHDVWELSGASRPAPDAVAVLAPRLPCSSACWMRNRRLAADPLMAACKHGPRRTPRAPGRTNRDRVLWQTTPGKYHRTLEQ